MTALKDRFWAKVLFKEFIRHYRKLTDEQIVADIEESMDALEDLDDSGESFGAKMVRWSMERAEEPSAVASRENGKKGGRPRKNKEITEDAPAREDGDGLTDAGNGALRNSLPSSGNSQDASTDKESTDASCNTAKAKPIAATKTGGSALDMPEPDKDKQAQAPAYGGNRRQVTETTTPLPTISKNDQETAEARQGRRTGGDSLTRVRSLPMPSKDELYDFVRAEGLDEADARDWFEMTVVDRDGRDRDGKRIRNWKAALKRFCKSRKDGRTA